MVAQSRKKSIIRGLQLGMAVALIGAYMPVKAMAETAPATPATAPVAVSAPAGPQEKGNPAIGQALFTGEKRFANGGPACISCHSTGVGGLDGGQLGPNLTKVYADPSKNGLLSTIWVNQPTIPVMGPVFSNRNITDDEMDHLRAFFEQRSMGGVASSSTPTFTIIGLGGFIGILIIFNIIWSGRYRNRNNGTAHDALWRNYGGKGGR